MLKFITFIILRHPIKNSIQELLIESSQFNGNDVLVNVSNTNSKLIFAPESMSFELQKFPKAILRETETTRKETGVNSLCIAKYTVQLIHGSKTVTSPIWLIPIEYSVNKLQQKLTLNPINEVSFMNPFLKGFLEEQEIPWDETKNNFTEQDTEQKIRSLIEHLQKNQLQTDDATIVGNFHHHRFEIVKELEELLEIETTSSNINELFGSVTHENPKKIALPNDLIFPADVDHEKVFTHVNNQNTIIQGPPGTGKSQVLSNLIGKGLAADKTIVIVSEKHVALEVLQKKLSKFGLDKLCFIASSDRLSHHFLMDLKRTWDFFENYSEQQLDNNFRLSEQYEANLQMTLDLLAQDDLIGGVSFHNFKSMTEGTNLSAYSYASAVPTIAHFIKVKPALKKLYENQLNGIVSRIKKDSVDSNDFGAFDQKIDEWLNTLNELDADFVLNSWADFSDLIRKAASCQIYENDLYKKYAPVFKPNSKAQQRFLRLRKNYLKAIAESSTHDQTEWKTPPSKMESIALKKSMQSGGYFEKRKTKKRWKALSNLPISSAINALDERLKKIAKSESLTQIKVEFCEIGVDSPEVEVPLIHQTLSLYNADQWKQLHEIPSDKRLRLTASHTLLSKLHTGLSAHFNFEKNLNFIAYLNELKTNFPLLLEYKKYILMLNESDLKAMGRNLELDVLEGELLNSHWIQFKDRFPTFSKFEINNIGAKVDDIINAQDYEASHFSRSIINLIAESYKEFHTLLTTPARKLSPQDKARKVRLRRGKAILVKEFSKTRSHPSMRELFTSDAREWIQLLKPIWLSNPTQISKCFPMEKALFDIAIFDEASQIPLQNALGTIHRGERIIVAGDEHQMGPSRYFKTGTNETQDLLHQANYYWKRVELQHHYRSENPQLIAFSNRHFYGGRLKAFPSTDGSSALSHHFVEGRFIDRKNAIEAEALIARTEPFLNSGESIGIVAFSEEQLNCIWNTMSNEMQQNLTKKLEKNQAFFKTLENVQGDECDRLFISFGYGKNADGEFHMRFGPMNTTNGRKRLNVLLTRAIKSIDFFCSIRSTGFKLSDNESINLIRQWIAHSELTDGSNAFELPFELEYTIDGSTITLNRIQNALHSARELATLQNVLHNRGWSVKYD